MPSGSSPGLWGFEKAPRNPVPHWRAGLGAALHAHGPSRMTQAIMELGATVCGPAPRCSDCPLNSRCEAFRQNATDRIPARQPRPATRSVELWLLAIQSEGRWLLHPPSSRGLLAGLWRWPALTLEATYEKAAEEPLPFGLSALRTWPTWTQVYSHRRERVSPVAIELEAPFPAPEGRAWGEVEAIEGVPLGTRDQRFREWSQTFQPSIE